MEFQDDLGTFSFDNWESPNENITPESRRDTGRKAVGRAKQLATDMLKDIGKGTMSGIGFVINRKMSNTATAYREVTSVASDFVRMKDEINKELSPTINSLKQVTTKLLPSVERMVPRGIYDRVSNWAKRSIDQTSQSPEEQKNAFRQDTIASALGSVFAAQQETDQAERKEDRINTMIDRSLGSIRHKESVELFHSMHQKLALQTQFMRGTFTAYLKRSLELKYKSLFLMTDMGEVLKLLAKITESGLNDLKQNTSLPDSQKARLFELSAAKLKNVAAEKFNSFISGYAKNVLGGIKSRVVNTVQNTLGSAVDIGDQIASTQDSLRMMKEMAAQSGMDISDMPGIGAMGRGIIGDTLGQWLGTKYGRKALDTVRPFTQDIEGATKDLKTRGILTLEDWRRQNVNTFGIKGALANLLPSLDSQLSVNTEGVQNGTEAANYDVASRRTLVEVIPAQFSRAIKYLKDIATGTDNEEEVYDVIAHRFDTATGVRRNIERVSFGERYSRNSNITQAMGKMRAAYIANNSNASLSSVDELRTELSRVLSNHAYHSYQLNPKELLRYVSGDDDSINIGRNEYIRRVFTGIENPQQVAQAMVNMLSDEDGNIDMRIVRDINADLIRQMDRDDYKKLLPQVLEGYGYRRLYSKDIDVHTGTINENKLFSMQNDMSDQELQSQLDSNTNYYLDTLRKNREERTKSMSELENNKLFMSAKNQFNTLKSGMESNTGFTKAKTFLRKKLGSVDNRIASIQKYMAERADHDHNITFGSADNEVETNPFADYQVRAFGAPVLPATADSSKLQEMLKTVAGALPNLAQNAYSHVTAQFSQFETKLFDILQQFKLQFAPLANLTLLPQAVGVPTQPINQLGGENIPSKIGTNLRASLSTGVSQLKQGFFGLKQKYGPSLGAMTGKAKTKIQAKIKGWLPQDHLNTVADVLQKFRTEITAKYQDLSGYDFAGKYQEIQGSVSERAKHCLENLDTTQLTDLIDLLKTKGEAKYGQTISYLDGLRQKAITNVQSFDSTAMETKLKGLGKTAKDKSQSWWGRIHNLGTNWYTRGAETASTLNQAGSTATKAWWKRWGQKDEVPPTVPVKPITPVPGSETDDPLLNTLMGFRTDFIDFKEELWNHLADMHSGKGGWLRRGIGGIGKGLAFGAGKLTDLYSNTLGKGLDITKLLLGGGVDILKLLAPGVGKMIGGVPAVGSKLVDYAMLPWKGAISIGKRLATRQRTFFSVYVKDNIQPGSPLLTKQQQEEGVIFEDGTPVETTADINRAVFDPKTKNVLITDEQVKAGLVDVDGVPISGSKFGGLFKRLAGGVFSSAKKRGGQAIDLLMKALGLGTDLGGGFGKMLLGGAGAVGKAGMDMFRKLFRLDRNTEKEFMPVTTRLDSILAKLNYMTKIMESQFSEDDAARLGSLEDQTGGNGARRVSTFAGQPLNRGIGAGAAGAAVGGLKGKGDLDEEGGVIDDVKGWAGKAAMKKAGAWLNRRGAIGKFTRRMLTGQGRKLLARSFGSKALSLGGKAFSLGGKGIAAVGGLGKILPVLSLASTAYGGYEGLTQSEEAKQKYIDELRNENMLWGAAKTALNPIRQGKNIATYMREQVGLGMDIADVARKSLKNSNMATALSGKQYDRLAKMGVSSEVLNRFSKADEGTRNKMYSELIQEYRDKEVTDRAIKNQSVGTSATPGIDNQLEVERRKIETRSQLDRVNAIKSVKPEPTTTVVSDGKAADAITSVGKDQTEQLSRLQTSFSNVEKMFEKMLANTDELGNIRKSVEETAKKDPVIVKPVTNIIAPETSQPQSGPKRLGWGETDTSTAPIDVSKSAPPSF